MKKILFTKEFVNFFDENSLIPRKREEIKNTRHSSQVLYCMTQGGLPLHKLPMPSMWLFYVTQNFKHGLQTLL